MKLFKEVEKDQKTLTKENKRLQIFIIIFMVIALCLGTFYFNVICFGAGCESKSPKPLIIINSNNENTDVETTQNDETQKRINEGYWYSDGILFFFNNGVFSIGRYGTDGGHNGMVGEFKKIADNKYKFNVVHMACTEDCMTPSNDYTLEVDLEYAVVSTGEVITINKMIKTEEGKSEELTNYEKTYQFVGTSSEEVEKYINNLNN